MLLSVPTPLVVPAGVVQVAGMACWDRLCLSSGVQRALLSARLQLGRCLRGSKEGKNKLAQQRRYNPPKPRLPAWWHGLPPIWRKLGN